MPRAVTRPRVVSVVASVGVVVCQPLPALSLPAAFPLPLFHPRPDRPNRPLSPCLPPSRPKSTPPHPTPSLFPSLFSILLPSFRPTILPSFHPSVLPSFHPSILLPSPPHQGTTCSGTGPPNTFSAAPAECIPSAPLSTPTAAKATEEATGQSRYEQELELLARRENDHELYHR